MGYFNNTNKQLEELLAKDPTYARSIYPGMQLGMANQFFNSAMPGSESFKRNILGAQGNTLSAINSSATDASQALSLALLSQGQTDQSFDNLQTKEADWKKFGLSNLNDAYGANAAEDQNVYQDKLRKYGNEVQIRGAQAANALAKRKALWNTVTDLANFGISAVSGNMLGKKPGAGDSGKTSQNASLGTGFYPGWSPQGRYNMP